MCALYICVCIVSVCVCWVRFFAQGSVDREVELPCTVCLVDEMDYLLSKDSSILYNFFSWPMQTQSGLIFIGVANTTNLPEVLTSRLQSRLDIHREVGVHIMTAAIVCVHVCMYVCIYICIYVRLYVCIYICIYVCIYVCLYVCMYR